MNVSENLHRFDRDVFVLDEATISSMKSCAIQEPIRRVFVEFGLNSNGGVLCMHRTSYLRPRRFSMQSVAISIAEGACDLILFHNFGGISQVIEMSAPGGNKQVYCRVGDDVFHTFKPRSDWAVLAETRVNLSGVETAELADWAPAETEQAAGLAYLASLLP